MPDLSAVVLCPEGSAVSRAILGLTVGERLLLALSYGGVKRVALVGSGPKPSSSRAKIEFVSTASFAPTDEVVVLSADTVFDRGLLGRREAPAGGALRFVSGAEAHALASQPDATLTSIGHGQAASGVGFALRVGGDADARAAHKALLLSLRKPIDGWISQNLNRHISTFITQFLVLTGLPPNVFTVGFLGIGLYGAYLASLGGPWWVLVAAGVLFQAQSVLDGCDGEIARLTYRFSKSGQWLDSIGDDLTNYSFCLGLALGQAKVQSAPWIAVLGFITLAMQLTATGVCYRRLITLGTGDLLAIPDLMTTGPQKTALGRAVSKLRFISKRDVFVFIIATLTAVQLPLAAFLIYSAGTIPTVVGVVLNDLRFGKQLEGRLP